MSTAGYPFNTMPAALCQEAQSVLVVIDVQTRLMAAMQADQREAVIRGAGALMRAADLIGIPTIISEQYPRGLGSTVPALLQNQPAVCERIEKTSFSVCGVTEFDSALAMTGRTQVVICGAEAHVCVLQSALQLYNAGLEVFIAADAICSRNSDNADNAIARMRTEGIVVSNVESVLFEWLEQSTHPAFRDVLAIIQ